MHKLLRFSLFSSLAAFAPLAFAAEGQTGENGAIFAFGVGGFALTLLVPIALLALRKLNARSGPSLEELTAFREARMRAHSASEALQEELNRSVGAPRA